MFGKRIRSQSCNLLPLRCDSTVAINRAIGALEFCSGGGKGVLLDLRKLPAVTVTPY